MLTYSEGNDDNSIRHGSTQRLQGSFAVIIRYVKMKKETRLCVAPSCASDVPLALQRMPS